MDITKLLGYGALMWAVSFIVVSIFVSFGINIDYTVYPLTTLVVVMTAFLLAKSLQVSNRKEMLTYSFCWVVVSLCLDALVMTRFTGWQIFYDWYIWLGYVLVLLIPLLAIRAEESE